MIQYFQAELNVVLISLLPKFVSFDKMCFFNYTYIHIDIIPMKLTNQSGMEFKKLFLITVLLAFLLPMPATFPY